MDNEMFEKAYAKAEKNKAIWEKKHFCINNKVCPKCAGDLKYETKVIGDAPILVCQSCEETY